MERGKFNGIINEKYQNFKGTDTFYAILFQLYGKQCKSRYELYVKADTILRARYFPPIKYTRRNESVPRNTNIRK